MENSEIKLKKPEGLYAALLTPFDEERKVNEEELRKLVTWLVDKGVDGIFPLGSCGEAIHLSFEERVRVVEVILQAVDGRVPVMPGASDSCASNAIKFIKELERLGCAGAVICAPYYLPISEDGVIAHYETIIEAAPNFPIVLYNAPAFSMPLTYNVVEKLAEYPNVVSMKDSSGSMVDFMNFMDIANKAGHMGVMTGREEIILPTLMMGGNGTMSALVGIVPEIMIEIYKAWQERHYDRAKELEFKIVELLTDLNAIPFPVGYKKALDIRRFNMGDPVRPLSDNEKESMAKREKSIRDKLNDILGESLNGCI